MKRNRFYLALGALLILVALSRQAAAAQYDPPTTYYNSATGTGATLMTQLRTIISSMTNVSYDNARFSAPYTDPDPSVPGNILLIYNRDSVDETWDTSPLIWNREHIWPQSRLGSASDSDQFNLRPADPTINSTRGNDAFGLDTTTGNHGSVGTNHYYPGDADAGDVARSQFYMPTRYSVLSFTDVTLPSTGGTQMGDLSSLIIYHFRDVPDEFERRRNHAIYGLAGDGAPAITNPYRQQNRNPYVDHPEWVWSVFVDQQNDSQLYVGDAPNINGGSAFNVDLGRVIVGAAVPAAHNVTLNKNGDDGTYYEVTTSGLATSSVTGKLNAFQVVTGPPTPKTRSLTVGLTTTTTTAGMRSGTVTINNMDITTAGGSGKGANDGNDTINVSLPVLDHANPSFSLLADQNTLNYDFGTVTMGSNVPIFQFDIANLVGTANYTAKLDLDSIGVSGDGARFPTDMFTFGNGSALAAGASLSFDAAIDTSTVGSFAATYTLNFSDENLSGATGLGSLTLNFTGEVEQAVVNTADFDGDGDVDGRDFLTWQRGFGTGTTLEAGDANGSETVDELDLLIWQDQYGQQPEELASFAAVPEPTSAGLVALCSGLCLLGIRRPLQVVL
jgi:endonuclease I